MIDNLFCENVFINSLHISVIFQKVPFFIIKYALINNVSESKESLFSIFIFMMGLSDETKLTLSGSENPNLFKY
jgi:hypothetical protein